MDITVSIGSDHGGFALKEHLVAYLKKKGIAVQDVGPVTSDRCDYPDFACRVASHVQKQVSQWGIVICTSGIGVSMCANRFQNVRAALCMTEDQARLSREHNNANVLALGAKYVDVSTAERICDVWLSTPFEGGRHVARVEKIDSISKRLQQ